MAAKPIFTEEQKETIHAAARRVYRKHFEGQSRQPQVKMALALDISQQSVSKLLRAIYVPSVKVATQIAILDNKETLEELIGEYATTPSSALPPVHVNSSDHPNLEKCITWHEDENRWKPWTIAAARAGYYGPADFPKADWVAKLDALEKLLTPRRR